MMDVTEAELSALLVKSGLMTKAAFKHTLQKAEEENSGIYEAILDSGLFRDDQLGRLIAEARGFSFIDPRRERIDEEIFRQIPEEMAVAKQVIAISDEEDGIRVAMLNPADTETQYALERLFGKSLRVSAATERGIAYGLKLYKPDLQTVFSELTGKLQEKTHLTQARDEVVTNTVDLLLKSAERARASDVHIEPYREEIVVRFRVDGVLQNVLQIPKDLYQPILSRVKILSRLRTDEHRSPQDGKFQFVNDEGANVDVRVSIVPTSGGENMVMRLLSGNAKKLSLPELGLRGKDLEKVHHAIDQPHGMILVTGPTGSGKTTTLYAVLKILHSPTVNIATIEDPIEYDMEGITQIQVDSKTNLTFAKGLRALVRQDPDIIMVGEIRDEETAGIAVNSALTGHLVLSTLHTNDAATTLPRLLDMDIEPFLISSTVNIVIAQRLVRQICPSCIMSYPLSKGKEFGMIEMNQHIKARITNLSPKKIEDVRLYRGAGCKVCAETGYTGRIGIFEVLEMSDRIRQAVMRREDADTIAGYACEEGMTTLLEDGITKALNGITTLDEVIRVAFVSS